MELSNGKPLIICAGKNGHYSAGIDRLEKTLYYHGYAGDMKFWRNEFPDGCPENIGDGQYNFKIHCFKDAFLNGYKVVLWVDSSFWAVKNPMPIFDYINENGLFFFKTGCSLAQTATDKLLNYSKLIREDLIDVPEFAGGIIGINYDNPNGRMYFDSMCEYMDAGMFGGSRSHDINDSPHPLFRFSRHDQSASSTILHKMGIVSMGEEKNWVEYKGEKNSESVIFFIGGI